MIYTDVYALSVHNTVVSNVDICMPGSIVFAALLLSYFLFIFSNGIYIQLVSRNLAFNEFFFFFFWIITNLHLANLTLLVRVYWYVASENLCQYAIASDRKQKFYTSRIHTALFHVEMRYSSNNKNLPPSLVLALNGMRSYIGDSTVPLISFWGMNNNRCLWNGPFVEVLQA